MSTPKPSSGRGRRSHLIGMTVGWIAGGLLVAFVAMRWFAFDYMRVPSDSMYPNVPSGSFVIIDKRGFGNVGPFRELKRVPTAKIERGDVVVFYVGDDGTLYLKRVIGLPGDRVTVRNRQLIINGATIPAKAAPNSRIVEGSLEYQLTSETINGREVPIMWLARRRSPDFNGIVPEGHYFMLGDNRDNALDSRYPRIGFVALQRIVGRVTKVIEPKQSGKTPRP